MPKRRLTISHLHREGSLATHHSESGMGTFAMVGILVGIGVVFLIIFLVANGGSNSGSSGTNSNQSNTNNAPATTNVTGSTTEKPFIRIPENSTIYKNTTYKFSFAYPGSFDKLSDGNTSSTANTGLLFKTESAPAVAKPVGNSGAILTGVFGAYVYTKADFKMLVGDPDIFVAPTKTGNSLTWKYVSKGATTQDVTIGAAYPVKSTKSQTGIPVFDFTLDKGTSRYGRYMFESGDYYVVIAMPYVSLPSHAALSASDYAAYNVIGQNLSSTVRAPLPTVASTDSDGFVNAPGNPTNTGTSSQPN